MYNNDLAAKIGGEISTYTTLKNVAYDSTNNKLMLKVEGADTPIPFSGQPQLIGQFSGNKTIDVSEYITNGDTVNNFIIEIVTIPRNSAGSQSSGGWNAYFNAMTPAKSLSGNSLTISGATCILRCSASGYTSGGWTSTLTLTYNLYHF